MGIKNKKVRLLKSCPEALVFILTSGYIFSKDYLGVGSISRFEVRSAWFAKSVLSEGRKLVIFMGS